MVVSREELDKLMKFQADLAKYHDASMAIYGVYNHRDYTNDNEVKLRIEREKRERKNINTSFGRLEQLIYNLIGGKPIMQVPALPGYQWDVFAEAFSSNFRSSTKGECLDMAVEAVDRAVGRAESLATKESEVPHQPFSGEKMFEDKLINKMSNEKISELCKEFNNVYTTNPNAGALLFRTILLLTLQYKLGLKTKDDLSHVLKQAIDDNTYADKHIKRILENLQGIPKTLLDATHHSKWILINSTDLQNWAQGLNQILIATFEL